MASKESISQGTKTREKILEKIIEYIGVHGYPPSVREIGELTGLASTSTVHSHLRHMFETGMLQTDGDYGTTRAIRVPGYKFVKVHNEYGEEHYPEH